MHIFIYIHVCNGYLYIYICMHVCVFIHVLLYNIRYEFSVRSWWPRVLWLAVTLWLVNSSTIRALAYNRCVSRKRSRDENHAVRFRQSADNHSRPRDMQPGRGVSDELARGWKCWHSLAPGVDMSLHPSLAHHRNINPFENKNVGDILL